MSAPTRAELLVAVDTALDAGDHVPCRTGGIAVTAAWTSDDAEEQRQAARACRSCPVLRPCMAYIETNPLEWGVYGGQTDAERRPKRGRPKKAAERSTS